ncbi:MAG: hypothetical protein KAG98_01445 [Lentisphaeria bacterium]|nr:hypothetical protein [Lentisphaeria bacterium]
MKLALQLTLAFMTTLSFAKDAVNHSEIIGKLKYKIVTAGSNRVVLLSKTGKVLWQHRGANTTDAQMLPNKNVLFSDGRTVTEVTMDNKVVFQYISDSKHRGDATLFAQRLPNGNTVVSGNAESRVVEVDKKGKVVFTLDLKKVNPSHNHQNLRMARKLRNGNYLVCHSGKHLVREYTPKGDVVLEIKAKGLAFGAIRLPNKHTIVSSLGQLTEYDQKGKEVWEFKPSKDLPKYGIKNMTGMQYLRNGNLVVGCYSAYDKSKGTGLGMFEITRAKKLVWGYRNLKSDTSHMAVQLLNRRPSLNIIH